MEKRLIINGDDFGYPKGSLEATIELHEAGILTSTSGMVNQPHWPEAATYLRDNRDLAAGVHLVMNAGRPVLPPEQVPSLVDGEGRFRDGLPLILRTVFIRTAQLKAEWRAQIDRFVGDTGRQPDHLDLHTSFPYLHPSWFRVNLELAQEYGPLPIRLPFDDALDHKAASGALGCSFLAPYIRWMGRRYQRMTEEHGLKRSNYVDMSFTRPAPAPDESPRTEYLLELLGHLPDGVTELVTHPRAEGPWWQDVPALRDPRVKQRIEDLGIELITYGDL
jgi:predicted glycoside hydrolase/deacetylase ChbG (UPF0249 family)